MSEEEQPNILVEHVHTITPKYGLGQFVYFMHNNLIAQGEITNQRSYLSPYFEPLQGQSPVAREIFIRYDVDFQSNHADLPPNTVLPMLHEEFDEGKLEATADDVWQLLKPPANLKVAWTNK